MTCTVIYTVKGVITVITIVKYSLARMARPKLTTAVEKRMTINSDRI